tara:strand:- start:3588 stop:4145 length:558 start_codon:yes stop_codon:yes gene_type:complete
MIKRVLLFLILLNFNNFANASIKNKIILKLKKINNISFNFEQTINKKKETGNCIIEYPKKIFCAYDNKIKKIIVSDGKSLVVKNLMSNQYYIYPLKKTPLYIILDKDYLISQIKEINERIIEDKFINFTLKKQNIEMNIFFDFQTLNLIGWQTEDIYQNLVITFIHSLEINSKIDEKKFKLPLME